MSVLKVKNGNEWEEIPTIKGKSAYEYAQDGGYTGTEQEFAQKLAEEYVGFEDYASTTDAGIIKIVSGGGITIDSNHGIKTTPATNNQVKGGTEASRQIVPNNQHSAAFYGLAKAAGDTTQSASSNAVGSYTDDAKKAIRKMLGLPNETWELINEAVVYENSTEIRVDTDQNGLPFKLSKLIAIFEAGASTTGARDSFYGTIQGIYNGVAQGTSFPSLTYPSATSVMMARIEIEAFVGAPVRTVSTVGGSEGNSVNVQQMPKGGKFVDYVTYLRIYQSGSTKSLIPAGSTLKLYGIRYDD